MDKQYDSLPMEQKREYIDTLTNDLMHTFLTVLKENPLSPLLQAWCTVPLSVDVLMQHPPGTPVSEEQISLFTDRENMASALLTILTNIFIHKPLAYRSPNLHISFTNSDGTTGAIVIDNLKSDEKGFILPETIKIMSH